jgi:hypothetical protein
MTDLRDGGRPPGGHGPTTCGPQQLRTRQAAAPGAVALLRRLELHPALHREPSPCSVDWSSTPPVRLPSCSTVEAAARLRHRCSRRRSRRRCPVAPPGAGSVRHRPRGGPATNHHRCRVPAPLSSLHPCPLPPTRALWSLRGEGDALSKGRVTGEGPAPCSAPDSAVVGAPPPCQPSPSVVPTFALHRADPHVGGSRTHRKRGDPPLLGPPADAGDECGWSNVLEFIVSGSS